MGGLGHRRAEVRDAIGVMLHGQPQIGAPHLRPGCALLQPENLPGILSDRPSAKPGFDLGGGHAKHLGALIDHFHLARALPRISARDLGHQAQEQWSVDRTQARAQSEQRGLELGLARRFGYLPARIELHEA